MGTLWRRLRARLAARRLDAELRQEIADHLEARTKSLVAEGMRPDAAAREARRQFGNVTLVQERTRELRGFPLLSSVAQDLRHGGRILARSPLFSGVAIASIAFGLAGGLGIFTIVNAMIMRPLVPGGEDIHRVYTSNRDGSPLGSVSYADYRDFARARAFGGTCAVQPVRANVAVGAARDAQNGTLVSGGCFALFRLRPAAGRLLTATSAPELVISYALWNRRFAADPSVIGSNVLLNGMPGTLVGVAPMGFSGTSLDHDSDFWAPIETYAPLLPPRALEDRRYRVLTLFVRLADGVSRASAEAELGGIAASLRQADPDSWTDARNNARRVSVLNERNARFAGAPGLVPALMAGVGAAIAGIVGIACINIATMLLARGASRTRELTIRLAIGASRGRLLRQLATESLLIALAGTAVALAAIEIAIRLFEAHRPEDIPAVSLAIDWRVAIFAGAVAIFATLLCGLLPALHVVRLAIAEGMKSHGAPLRARWIRAGARELLIVVQVAVSVGLVLVSTLFVRGLAAGAAASPGFTTDGVVALGVDLSTVRGTPPLPLAERLLDALGRVPNVAAPSIAAVIPLTGTATGFALADASGGKHEVDGNVISPGYLSTVNIALRRGRDFTPLDRAGATPVAIVSETFARQWWHSTDVIGRRLDSGDATLEVVGVAADIKYRTVSGPFPPLLYIPFAQEPRQRFIIHLRARNGGETLAALDAAARAVDPRIIIEPARPLEQRIEDVRGPERLAGWAGGAIGAVQLSLVMMALWALVAYAVERRTPEIGIRRALGATESGLVGMLLRPAVILVSGGAVLGIVAGSIAAYVFQSEFIGLASLDPVAAIPVVAVVAIVAVTAAWIPAQRATRIDPIVALRSE